MRERLPFYLLEDLASRSEQIRFIRHATKEEYLLPSELLNDAWHFCERALYPEAASHLTIEQLAAVNKLRSRIESAPANFENEPDVIDTPEWIAIRQQAIATLVAFDHTPPDN